ncbi:MAG: hypothetical protein QNJ16_05110 [Rhodobacter sp.]|nr:hypothetical protein [Rhodobacter sp.]
MREPTAASHRLALKFLAVTCLALTASCTAPDAPRVVIPQPGPTAGGAPQVLVSARGVESGPAGDAAVPLPPCVATGGPVEITVSLSDPDGLTSARIAFDGGRLASNSLRVTPAGQDIIVSRRGAPGIDVVRLDFDDSGVPRTGAVVNFTTAAPHTGAISVTATDRTGATARVGQFQLAASDAACAAEG